MKVDTPHPKGNVICSFCHLPEDRIKMLVTSSKGLRV